VLFSDTVFCRASNFILVLLFSKTFRILEEDRQLTYNVTLRRVRATIFAVEKQRVFHNLSVYL